jgi:hypothetical protein
MHITPDPRHKVRFKTKGQTGTLIFFGAHNTSSASWLQSTREEKTCYNLFFQQENFVMSNPGDAINDI